LNAGLLAYLPSAGGVGNVFEDFVVLVQRMADFVDTLPLQGNQFAIPKCFGLEEETHLV